MTAPTWETRELPILRVALRKMDEEGIEMPGLKGIQEETGLSDNQMMIALNALADAGYIEFKLTQGDGKPGGFIWRIGERTRRELGAWPTAESVVDQLVARIQSAAEAETDPEEKSRLLEAAQTLGTTGYRIAVDLLTRYAEKRAGVG